MGVEVGVGVGVGVRGILSISVGFGFGGGWFFRGISFGGVGSIGGFGGSGIGGGGYGGVSVGSGSGMSWGFNGSGGWGVDSSVGYSGGEIIDIEGFVELLCWMLVIWIWIWILCKVRIYCCSNGNSGFLVCFIVDVDEVVGDVVEEGVVFVDVFGVVIIVVNFIMEVLGGIIMLLRNF